MTRRVIAFDPSELRSLVGKLPRGRGCDFCSARSPGWRYPARDVGLGSIIYGPEIYRPVSLGGWAACTDCSELIEDGNWPALARHTLRSLNLDLSHAGAGMRVRLLAQFHAAHECFRKARTGPRVAA